MKRPTNLKIGDQFRVIEEDEGLYVGEIISLLRDDGTDCPFFWKENKSNSYYINFSRLEPYTKTVSDAQVGDVLVSRGGYEYLVLERFKNTVVLSHGNDFKKAGLIPYTFDQLEEYFTLKDEPVVVDDKTAEAMKLLKEAGYKISK